MPASTKHTHEDQDENEPGEIHGQTFDQNDESDEIKMMPKIDFDVLKEKYRAETSERKRLRARVDELKCANISLMAQNKVLGDLYSDLLKHITGANRIGNLESSHPAQGPISNETPASMTRRDCDFIFYH